MLTGYYSSIPGTDTSDDYGTLQTLVSFHWPGFPVFAIPEAEF